MLLFQGGIKGGVFMARYTVVLSGDEELEEVLRSHADTDFRKAIKATTVKLLRNAKEGTPVDTGKLKQHLYADYPTSSDNPEGLVYYTMHYAPHVEYGHRTVSGGYVQGQYYLKKAVQGTQDEFKRQILGAVEEDE